MKKIFILVALLATGCVGVKKQEDVVAEAPVTTTTKTEGGDIKKLPTERPVYRAAETIYTDLVNTQLDVSFDWNNSRLIGKETLTAKPHFYASDKLILDAKGMEIKSVMMKGKALTYTYANDVLTITLDKVYQRGEEYTIVIDYIARPDERATEGSQAITSDKGLYFINPKGEDPTKMPQIWTQGETEASSVWFPTIDSPNHKTKQEMFITVADKYVTLSNGKFLGSRKNPDGTRTDHWKQELPHSPYLFMMGVGEFRIVKDTYRRPDGSLMDVHYYVEPEWEQYGDDIFGETPEMIAFFSQKLGVEYPWDKYHQIVVRDYVSGAMENTGAVVFGDFAYKTDRELLDANDRSTIAHELFHHWFGDLVTAESWSNLPLNESFANYSQYLWDEHRDGVDEADFQAESEKQGYYQSAMAGGYHNLIWFDYKSQEDMFDGHSYNKGGRILHMLRNYLGDDAFFLGMQTYLKANAYKPAEYHQLRLAFEEVSGEDLNWFFDQWFLASGHPTLKVSYTISGNTVNVNVAQTQDLSRFPIFRLPIDVMVFDDNGGTKHRIVVDKIDNSFALPFTGSLKNVLFDSQAMQLGNINETKDAAWYVHQYYNGKRWAARKAALNNGLKTDTPQARQMVLDALKDPFWDIRMTAIDKAKMLTGGDLQIAIEQVLAMAVNDSVSAVRSAALSFLSTQLTNTALQPLLEERIAKDQSYVVIINALNQLSKVSMSRALQLAEGLEKERSSKMLGGIAMLYMKNAGVEKYPFYERILTGNSLQGFDGIGALQGFTVFLGRMDVATQKKALKVFEYQAANGGVYAHMFLPQCINYVISSLTTQIETFREEEAKAKQSGNSNAADIARAKQTEAQSVIDAYNKILTSLETEGGH